RPPKPSDLRRDAAVRRALHEHARRPAVRPRRHGPDLWVPPVLAPRQRHHPAHRGAAVLRHPPGPDPPHRHGPESGPPGARGRRRLTNPARQTDVLSAAALPLSRALAGGGHWRDVPPDRPRTV